jgi:hypothetical protein
MTKSARRREKVSEYWECRFREDLPRCEGRNSQQADRGPVSDCLEQSPFSRFSPPLVIGLLACPKSVYRFRTEIPLCGPVVA